MNINKLYFESVIFRWTLIVISIIPIMILGTLDLVTYNWFQDDYSGVMSLIIWISVLTSIAFQFTRINVIKLILVIISDFTLIVVINRGIIEGNYFSKLVDLYLDKDGFGTLLLGLNAVLVFDWIFKTQLIKNKKKNCIQSSRRP